jgi:uncharacterized protein (TIGR03435 family)
MKWCAATVLLGSAAFADIFTAMQQQLGLSLEQRKVPVNGFVVDRAEKTPKEN